MNAATEIESCAFHEAGHCAIRSYFGMEVTELWVDKGHGNCRFCVSDRGDVGLFQDIAGCLAGRIAEDRLCGRKGGREAGDYQRALDCALRLNGGDSHGAELLLQWMEYRTEKLVEKHWPKIQRLAFGLLNSIDNNGKACLTGEQIRETIA